MANTPNMNLVLPIIGNTLSPTWAQNLNNDLTILDQHNHVNGAGALVPTAGLNINADLPLNNNNLISARTLRMQAQSPAPGLGTDLGCFYLSGVDAYFIDGGGNNIRLTQSGSVAGSAGTITGLPSGTASASFSGGVFTFQAATATPANLDGGSVVLRNNVASSKGLTLSPPNAMGANYTLVLPPIPAQTNVLTLDVSGNMASITYDAVGVGMTATGANAIAASITTVPAGVANVIGNAITDPAAANNIASLRTRATGASTEGAGGVPLSSSCGAYSATSAAFTTVTNLSVVLTTSGRPIAIALVDDSSLNASFVGVLSSSNLSCVFAFFRGSTQLTNTQISSGNGTSAIVDMPPGTLSFVDIVAAGTYTYTLKVKYASSSATALVQYCKLIAYEL